MFLSIIVPVHNVEEYIQDCVESILDQSFQDFELLLIENGSTDKSMEVCNQYKYHDKVSVYSIDSNGVSSARNFGLNKALGEYIWFVDSDDIISVGAIECLNKKVRELSEPDVLIFAHDEIINEQKTTPKLLPIEGRIDKATAVNGLFNANLWSGFVWNKLIKNNSEVLKKCPFPENIHMIEDLVFTTKLFLSYRSYAVINSNLYSYRQRRGSISRVFNEKKLSAFDAYEIILNELNGHGEYGYAVRIINNAKVDFSRQVLTHYRLNDIEKYNKIKNQYRSIIIKNFSHITTIKAKIAAVIVLVSPKLLRR